MRHRRSAASDSRPTFVYRCYDADGRLLYVGCSVNPVARVENHRQTAWWGNQIATVRNLVFPDRVTALSKERRAIHQEMPRCNVKGRWYASDPRENWAEADYIEFRRTVIKSADGVLGVNTMRLIAAIDAERAHRFDDEVAA